MPNNNRIFSINPSNHDLDHDNHNYLKYKNPEDAFKDVINKDLKSLKQFTGNFNSLHDYHNNNLLHVAILGEDLAIIRFLLEKAVDKHYYNKFYKTPYDYAIATHQKAIISLLNECNCNGKVTYEEYKNLQEQNYRQQDDIAYYRKDNEQLINKNKRLRDDNEYLTTKVSLLKADNNDLTEANKKLKVSVDNLTKALKK